MLTDKTIKFAAPQAKPYRLTDGRGMYVEIRPTGSKLYRLKYRFGGAERRLALGAYPDTSLSQARAAVDRARAQLADGVDPGAERRAAKLQASQAEDFESIAREWYAKREPGWAETHKDKVLLRLTNDVFPWVGRWPIHQLTPRDILAVLRRVEARGAVDTAHRELQYISSICRYAVVTGRLERNPAADLKGEALEPVRKDKHFATITDPAQVGGLMRAIESYQGSLVTRCALKLAPLTIVRPGELRAAEWTEFDLDAAEWRIGATRMKMRRPHLVPLSRQAVEVLRELQPLTGSGRFVFPNGRTPSKVMSENAVLAALRNMGYPKGAMTGHGFRSMASTLLNEAGWNRDVIERQLAHVEGNAVRRAYNHAEYREERARMMQAWADYLDLLRDGHPDAKLSA